MTKLSIIIQARLGSTRLPNKMILPFYKNKGILELMLSKLKEEINIPVIVATTSNKKDDKIEEIALKYECSVFRGSEENVLKRFIDASNKFEVNKIIRICADNPFLDVNYLKIMINYLCQDNYDYLYYCLSDNKPTILTHYGFWGEGVSLNALKKIQKRTSDSLYTEHVTNYIYNHIKEFNTKGIIIPKEIEKAKIRLTIDTIEDFELSKTIYCRLVQENINFEAINIINFVKENNTWLDKMNKQIEKNTK